MRGLRFFSASVFSGVSLWLVIAVLSGRKAAWESGLYWSLGLLGMLLIGGLVGRYTRIPAWSWWLGFALGQGVMLVSAGRDADLGATSMLGLWLASAPVAVGILVSRRLYRRATTAPGR